MQTIRIRHYSRRLRWSERLPYQMARFVLWAIPLSLLVALLAYAIAARG
jgi:hypothetical protein